MNQTNAPRGASAIGVSASLALGTALTLALSLTAGASADTIDVGYVTQTSPRPNIIYTGAYGSFISSQLVNDGTQRTLVTVDLHGLMQSLGLNYLESVSIVDGGNNQYNSSPGADLDYLKIDGLGAGTSTTLGYAGPNTPHTLEGSTVLGIRSGLMDAVTGDQDYNCLHFVSLGYMGALTATFSTPTQGGGGGGGGGGPEEHGGSGGETPPIVYSNLVAVTPGLKLHISEAGLGERYLIRISGSAVPAPAGGLLALAGLLGRRRRR